MLELSWILLTKNSNISIVYSTTYSIILQKYKILSREIWNFSTNVNLDSILEFHTVYILSATIPGPDKWTFRRPSTTEEETSVRRNRLRLNDFEDPLRTDTVNECSGCRRTCRPSREGADLRALADPDSESIHFSDSRSGCFLQLRPASCCVLCVCSRALEVRSDFLDRRRMESGGETFFRPVWRPGLTSTNLTFRFPRSGPGQNGCGATGCGESSSEKRI